MLQQSIARRGCVLAYCLMLAFACVAGPARAADSAMDLVLDPNTRRQPAGGAFQFTVSPPPNTVSAQLCATSKDDCLSLTVQLIETTNDNPRKAKYRATLPDKLNDWSLKLSPYYSIFDRPNIRETASAALARAYLSVYVDGKTEVLPVGYTSRLYAAAVALVLAALAVFVVARFASLLNLSGARRARRFTNLGLLARVVTSPFRVGSALLSLITSENGVASLSKFQVLLWTAVVGGGAVYVAILNNALMPLNPTMLALLGVAGLAGVLTEVKNAQTTGGGGYDKPGPVQDLRVEPLDNGDLRVVWRAPAGVAPIAGYVVKRSGVVGETKDNLTGPTIADFVRTSVRLVGLESGTRYGVKVWATNPAGEGDAAFVEQTTAAPAAPPANAPPAPTHLRTTLAEATESSIPLHWDYQAQAQPVFEIEQRRTDSDEAWSKAQTKARGAVKQSPAVVVGLLPGATYQFRVRIDGGLWSKPETFSTIRVPRWSDLVTDSETPSEIDVSRVQMIIFTLIIAGFVVAQIGDTGSIPDISSNYLLLMGLSNGVYITTKFVRR